MSGFEIALSLFFIAGCLFIGRYLHNKEERSPEDEFRDSLRKRWDQ